MIEEQGASDKSGVVSDDGRCPECGEDEMDGARCYYCGFHDYKCGFDDCKWCAPDTPEIPHSLKG